MLQMSMKYLSNDRASFKTSVLKEQPLKNAVLQPVGRKAARASAKLARVLQKLDSFVRPCLL
jgi:hypothetical protein